MPTVFQNVNVYPLLPEYTLVDWTVHPQFTQDPPWTFTVEVSKTGNPDSPSDWTAIAAVTNTSYTIQSVSQQKQHLWGNSDRVYYRIKMTTAAEEEYYSSPEPSWGGLTHRDRSKVKEMYRQECLRMRKTVGSAGLLYRIKTWGVRSTSTTVDPNTNEVIDTQNTVDYGTGFDGGYWGPFVYWMDIDAGRTEAVDQGNLGTEINIVKNARALAWPMPRTKDIWVDCTTGIRYEIKANRVAYKVRHVPVVLNINMMQIPRTDVVYDLGKEQYPVPDIQEGLSPGHWFTNHWNAIQWDTLHWI